MFIDRQFIRDAYEHYNNGDRIKAYRCVRTILKTDWRNTSALMLYAEIIKTHQPEQALKILKQVQIMHPDWDRVDALVDELEETLVN